MLVCTIMYSIHHIRDYWGNTYKIRLWPIFRLQKIAIRLMFNLRKKDCTSLTFQRENILKLPDIYTYLVTIFMYKLSHGKTPELFVHMFSTNSNYHNYNTRRRTHFHIPIYKTSTGNLFITKTGVTIWNTIKSKCYDSLKLGILKQITRLKLTKKYT